MPNKAKQSNIRPRTMVRYDDTAIGYPHIWVCKICLLCLLSAAAAEKHMELCCKPTETNNKNLYDAHYKCQYCGKEFSRLVNLVNHLNTHSDTSSSEDEQSNQVQDAPSTSKHIHDEN